MKKFIYILILPIVAISLNSCEKILETELPGGEIPRSEALKTEQDIRQLLQSCYDVNANVFNGRIQNLGELLSDNLELQNISGELGEVYSHNVQIFNGTTAGIYADPYITIFRANQLLEVLNESDFGMELSEVDQIRAQAYFLRAISHWEVLKLWAQPYGFEASNTHNGVVYKQSTKVEVLARNSVEDNYNQIIGDLNEALNIGGLDLSNKYYASEDAIKAYLAKIYFQKGDYQMAADMASQVIDPGRYTLGTQISRFQPDTITLPEIIFKSRSFVGGVIDNRSTGFTSNYRSDLSEPFFRASKEFYDTYAGDTNDVRLNTFFELRNEGEAEEYVAVRKFNRVYFDVPILHLTDLKLLRAEALALLNQDLATAISDINDIRERAYGSDVNNLSPVSLRASVLNAARYERRIEMFGEGDRIQQLKRRGAIENENIEVRDDPWNCNGMILQFPSAERTSKFELNPQGGC